MNNTAPGGAVLVVEDDPSLNQLFANMFERAGREVRGVYSIRQATGYLDVFGPPMLVTLDLDLPDGDGVQLLRILQEERFANTKIVIVSQFSSARHDELDQYRVDKRFTKPVSPMELMRYVRGAEG